MAVWITEKVSKSNKDESGYVDNQFELTIAGPDDEHREQISFSWWIALLLIIFGISSWIAVSGLWMELPIFVSVLPEGWNISAYLSIIIQLANIAPLLYVLFTRVCPSLGQNRNMGWFMYLLQPPERVANFMVLIVGLVASLLLVQFWNAVVVIPGLPANAVNGVEATPEALYGHSLGLFVLTFALGMVDCMSSVTFLAYLAHMPADYAGALLFGETASGLLPSLYALGQGASNVVCNYTGTTDLPTVQASLNFGVSTFMGLVAGTSGLSLIAFALLDCLPNGLGRSVTLVYRHHHSVPTTTLVKDDVSGFTSEDLMTGNDDAMVPKCLFWICLFLTGYSSCLTNGLLPSIQPYSTASYSTTVFHLAVTLCGIVAPLVAFSVTAVYGHDQLGLWIRSVLCYCRCRRRDPSFIEGEQQSAGKSSPQTPKATSLMASIVGDRLALILVLITVIGSLFAGYIIYLAASSPSPPELAGLGPAFSVLAWILMTAAFNIQKAWITLHMVKYGSQRNLRTLGVANQVGSVVGALISFLLTAIFNVFVSKQACT